MDIKLDSTKNENRNDQVLLKVDQTVFPVIYLYALDSYPQRCRQRKSWLYFHLKAHAFRAVHFQTLAIADLPHKHYD